MILPLLGGAPSVWIVCSLCFQTILLAGYGYAHWVGTRLPVRTQVVLQLALAAAVLVVMPVSVDEAAAERLTAGHPTLGLLVLLVRTIGLPFFVLSTSSPLLQRWFAEVGERDPYHLYAASNAGSMLALLGYPFAIEPVLAVRAQSRGLQVAFVAYAALLVGCAVAVARRGVRPATEATPAPPQVRVTLTGLHAAAPVSTPMDRWRERVVWVALAFAPSSLLLGATEYVTTDVASIPLLWVVPLALYLTSFIVAFAKKQPFPVALWSKALAVITAVVTALTLADVARPLWPIAAAHVLLLFVASVVCHRALAERRPHVSRLTEFYLLMSIGGVLGGLFNGVVGPIVFNDLYEYPIAIGLVCLGRAWLAGGPLPRLDVSTARDIGLALAVAFAAFSLDRATIAPAAAFAWKLALPLFLAFVWAKRPVRWAVVSGALLLTAMLGDGNAGRTLWASRGFFGVLKVTTTDRERRLVSGRTMHGSQSLEPSASHAPRAYYHPAGPAGDVLGPLMPADAALPARQVGVIGLGVGSLAGYARPGDTWTFFELDPAVVHVAREYFSYLKTAEQVAQLRVEIGDARLRLRDGAASRFDVLVLDAFSSDAIPVHLVTREALAVYRRALRPGGMLLVHVTNEHVRLPPVFGALAQASGMAAIVRRDDAAVGRGEVASEWVVLTETGASLDLLLRGSKGWRPLTAPPPSRLWTDDYADVLGALRF